MQMVTAVMKLKDFCSWKKSYDQPRQHIKKQRYHFADKGPCSQSYEFSSSHVWMWELDHKESWGPKNLCFWNVVLEKTLESPLDCKEIKPVNPKGNQHWIFIGGSDAEAEAPILWPLDTKNWLTGKDRDAGKNWRQEEKGTTEGEMVGWRHWLNGHEFEQTLGVGERREAWRAAVHGVTKSQTRLSDWRTTRKVKPLLPLQDHQTKPSESTLLDLWKTEVSSNKANVETRKRQLENGRKALQHLHLPSPHPPCSSAAVSVTPVCQNRNLVPGSGGSSADLIHRPFCRSIPTCLETSWRTGRGAHFWIA